MNVSVIIPTYNSANTLERSINSVLLQTYPANEIIVIDDGSIDNTQQIANKYRNVIKYIQILNSGVSVARNTGINQSSCDWIAFLDSDDQWLPNKLELQTNLLKKFPEVKWCSGNVQIVKGKYPSILTINKKRSINIGEGRSLLFFEACLNNIFFQTSTLLIKRNIFKEIGTFDISLKISEDRDLWWRIAARHPQIAYVYDVCALYYVDNPSSLTKINNNRTESLQLVCKHLEKSRNENSNTAYLYEKYVRSLCFRYLLRYAAKEITLSPEIFNYAKSVMKLTLNESFLLFIFNLLPSKIARILV